jgi:hypothetical protein
LFVLDRHASVHFELSETEKAGQYEAKVFIANIKLETITLELDDLLEKQVLLSILNFFTTTE